VDFFNYQSKKNNSIITNHNDQFNNQKQESTFNREYSTSIIGKSDNSTKHSTPSKENHHQMNLKNSQPKLSTSRKPTVNPIRIYFEGGIVILIISLIALGFYKF